MEAAVNASGARSGILSGIAAGLAGVVLWLGGCGTLGGIGAGLGSAGWSGRVGPPAEFRSEPEIRVRVRAGIETAKLEGSERFVARAGGVGGSAQVIRGPIVLSAGPGGVVTTGSDGTAKEWGAGAAVEVMADARDGGESASIKIGSDTYPGFATITPDSGRAPGALDVVMTMGIERYLPGVLVGELFKDWPRETYEAQAVAARSYALHERARARTIGRAYDVNAGTSDQMFSGAAARPVAVEAVRDTRGLVVAFKGQVLRAYYSSACAGRAGSASAVWPTNQGFEFNRAAPIQAKKRGSYCEGSPFFRWEASRTDAELSNRLRGWARSAGSDAVNLTRPRQIEVRERNGAGRPTKYRLTDDGGRTFTLTAEELRTAMNFPAPGEPEITRQTRVHSGDFEAEVWAGTFKIRGRGFGHGVGMCQWCAKGMADRQMGWREMMAVFYPGAKVVKAY